MRYWGSAARPLHCRHTSGSACPSGAAVGRARLNPLDGTPQAAVGRARLDPMQPVPDSGDGNPPGFSAGNAGKSQKQNSVIPAVSAGCQRFWGVLAQITYSHGTDRRQHRHTRKWGTSAGWRAYPRHSPRVKRRRSIFLLARALRVSRSASHRQANCPLRPKPRRGWVSGGRVSPCCSIMASSRVSSRSSVVSHDRV